MILMFAKSVKFLHFHVLGKRVQIVLVIYHVEGEVGLCVPRSFPSNQLSHGDHDW